MSIKAAAFVAAGLGSRFQAETKDKPKGFIKINGKTLIERSIDNLEYFGIERIFIGTGYLSEFYEELSKKNKNIKCIKSDRYKETSSMYTLYNMRNIIKEDFILLESDLLYEKNSIKYLVEDKTYKDIILASGQTNSGDEVYIEVDNDNNLVNISKDKSVLKNIYAELVGISKISLTTYNKMNAYFSSVIDKEPKIDYELILSKLAFVNNKIFVKKVDKLVWCEIDDEGHYRRALNEIITKL